MIFLILMRSATVAFAAFSIEAGWRAFSGSSWLPPLVWVVATAISAAVARIAARRAMRIESEFLLGGLARVNGEYPRLSAAMEDADREGKWLDTLPLRRYIPSKGRLIGQLAVGAAEVVLSVGSFAAIFIGAFFVPAGNWTLLTIGIGASFLGLLLTSYKRRTFTQVNLRRLAEVVLSAGHPLVPEALMRSFWAVAQSSTGRDGSFDGQLDRTEEIFQHFVLAWEWDRETKQR